MKRRYTWLWYGITAAALLTGLCGGIGIYLRQRHREREQARVRQRLLLWHRHIAGSLNMDQQADWEATAASEPQKLLRAYLMERPYSETESERSLIEGEEP